MACLMLRDLDPKARQLADYMGEISEQAYAAGWMHHLEFELWDIVQRGPRSYGRFDVTAEHIDRLSALSHAADGWVIFDEEREEMLVPMSEWVRRFRDWRR